MEGGGRLDEKACFATSHIKKPEGSNSNTPEQQQEDYYMENGFLVFTAKYLKNRGFCCGNGCRHCPYE